MSGKDKHSRTPTEDRYSTNSKVKALKGNNLFKVMLMSSFCILGLSIKIHPFLHSLVQILFPFFHAVKTLLKRLFKSMHPSDNN